METLNITAGSNDPRERIPSNLSIRVFVLDGVCLRSPEGFIQGIKFPVGDPRREEAFAAAGLRAKAYGKQAERRFVWWNGKRIDYGSPEHRALIERAITESFVQNPYAYAILQSTRGMVLTHDTGEPDPPNSSLPREEFCRILTALRDRNDLQSPAISARLLLGGLAPSFLR